jgi:hypothetical protein
VVVASLKSHEVMDGGERLWIGCREAELSAAWEIADRVGNVIPARGHDGGSRDVPHVNESRRAEVAHLERGRDRTQVPADLCDAGRVVDITHELDPPSVRERVEVVRGGVLVDAHRLPPALLDADEPGIRSLLTRH